MSLSPYQGIAEAMRTGDVRPLQAMLDCDRYTREGDWRALDGLGMRPRALDADERAFVQAALEEIEERAA